jgi:hypothetical protein
MGTYLIYWSGIITYFMYMLFVVGSYTFCITRYTRGSRCMCVLNKFPPLSLYIVFIIIYLGAFCIKNARTLSTATVTVLVAIGLCPVATESI